MVLEGAVMIRRALESGVAVRFLARPDGDAQWVAFTRSGDRDRAWKKMPTQTRQRMERWQRVVPPHSWYLEVVPSVDNPGGFSELSHFVRRKGGNHEIEYHSQTYSNRHNAREAAGRLLAVPVRRVRT